MLPVSMLVAVFMMMEEVIIKIGHAPMIVMIMIMSGGDAMIAMIRRPDGIIMVISKF